MTDRRQFLKQAAFAGATPWIPVASRSPQIAASERSLLQSVTEAASLNPVVLENPEMKLVINGDGTARSLIHKPSGQECLAGGRNLPVFAVTQYRPYDNELQLSYTAKPTAFSAQSARLDGDHLVVSFALVGYEALIRVKTTDQYISFQLEKLEYKGYTALRPKKQTPIDEAVFLQLPIQNRRNVGQWLNVVWDEDIAVNLLATDPHTRVDVSPHDEYQIMLAGGVDAVQLEGVGAALIVTKPQTLLERIAKVEEDFDLPRGAESRMRKEYKYSYYEMLEGTPETIGDHINFATAAGFRTMDIYYRAFAKTSGHFPWRADYPNGMADLRKVVQSVADAGLIPGIHIHYNKTDKQDAYVSPCPDPRLNRTLTFTLAQPLDAGSSTVTVYENPRRCTLDDDRRILKLGDELIEYERYSTAPPYQFLNCKRGILGSHAVAHPTGAEAGQLDVDTWPLFVRFTQDTDIQQEVAERLAKIYRDAGFRFVYYDGAEDVPGPDYWYTVSRPQWVVYKSLNPKPLFGEGACKSHFSWHILTRGNAFDVFRPEVCKDAIRAYPATEAPLAARDFTAINFGWIGYWAPGQDTIGSQPDMLEYVTSRAAAWDCPVSLVGHLDVLHAHPRTADNLEVLRRWEEVRVQGWLTRQQKMALRNLEQEHILLIDESGKFELASYEQIAEVAGKDRPARGFIFQRSGDVYVVFWNTAGEGTLEIALPEKRVQCMRELGKPIPTHGNSRTVRLPLSERKFLRCRGTSLAEVKQAFQQARIL